MLTIFGRSSVVNPIKMFLASQLHSSYTYFVLEADQTSFNRAEVQLKVRVRVMICFINFLWYNQSNALITYQFRV